MNGRSDFRDVTRVIYAALSGPAATRDLESLRGYYHPDARLIRTGSGEDGTPWAQVMSFDEHVASVRALLADTAFTELELAHRAQIFGNVAQVISVYRSVYGEGTDARVGRGVNLFSFFDDGEGWKIISVIWDNERPGLSLEAAGLLAPGEQPAGCA